MIESASLIALLVLLVGLQVVSERRITRVEEKLDLLLRFFKPVFRHAGEGEK